MAVGDRSGSRRTDSGKSSSAVVTTLCNEDALYRPPTGNGTVWTWRIVPASSSASLSHTSNSSAAAAAVVVLAAGDLPDSVGCRKDDDEGWLRRLALAVGARRRGSLGVAGALVSELISLEVASADRWLLPGLTRSGLRGSAPCRGRPCDVQARSIALARLRFCLR